MSTRDTPLLERLRQRAGLRKILENVSWLVVERVALQALQFVVSVWFINYLGPEQYGKFAYAVSYAALFVALAGLGLDSIVIRELSGRDGDEGEILGSAFTLRALAGLCTLALIAVSILVVTDDATTRLLVIVIAASVLADPTQVVDLWFQSRIQSKYVAWTRSGVTLAALAARVALILLGLPLIAFAWLFTLQSFALGLAFLLLFAARRPSDVVPRWSPTRSLRLLRDSWPLIVAGFSVTVYMRIDRIMLGQMLGNHDVGTYSTAAAISEAWNFIPVVIGMSLFPIVVRSRQGNDPGLYAARMQALYDVMAVFAYGVAVLMTVLGPWLIGVLFSQEFSGSARILQIHIWSLLFVALGVARSRFIVAENLIRFSMIATLVGGALNVTLNWLLIPWARGEGAAAATVAAYAVAAYVSGLFSRPMHATTRQMTRAILAPLRLRATWREIREIL